MRRRRIEENATFLFLFSYLFRIVLVIGKYEDPTAYLLFHLVVSSLLSHRDLREEGVHSDMKQVCSLPHLLFFFSIFLFLCIFLPFLLSFYIFEGEDLTDLIGCITSISPPIKLR